MSVSSFSTPIDSIEMIDHPHQASSSPLAHATSEVVQTPLALASPSDVNGASSSSSSRVPVVVPRKGDHVVNVSTLWPERPNSGAGTGVNRRGTGTSKTTPFAPSVVPPLQPTLVSSSSGATTTVASASASSRTGAEEIVSERTGSLGHGKLVAEDGNVHNDATHKRPVVLLPECCEGALGLKIPELIQGHISNVTLPSRLALLGRQSYEIIAALRPINLGNAVLGFAPVWGKQVRSDLFVLPLVFSKASARIYIFLRILLMLVFLVFFFQFAQVWDLNIGRAWFLGSSVAIFVMFRLAQIRRAPDGVMAFCRSMGAPEIEEYMFSYSWKVEPDAIRTLAKAVWNNSVGVWIDVVKLCPGDEIRPMVRTMVNRVHRCVVFLSPAYIASPNCCVEFHEAVQWPEKLVICILQPVPSLNPFLAQLEAKGAVIVHGLRELIVRLDEELCDTNNASAWLWWRKQKISSSGVPSHVVPTYWTTIPKFTLTGALHISPRSLTAGPIYLAGDCSKSGQRFFPPYLFFLAVGAVVANFVDLYFTFRNTNCVRDGAIRVSNGERVDWVEDVKNCHNTIDYVWLGIMAACNLAPFTAWSSLFETRMYTHPVMRPLLASKSMNGGVKINVNGLDTDPIVVNLNRFLTTIGHNARDAADDATTSVGSVSVKKKKMSVLTAFDETPVQRRRSQGLAAGFSQSVTVYVMRDFIQRDALFGKDEFPFDPRTSLFVWSGLGDPFTKDEIGERLMRFLVLVAAWDKSLLAENLFSAIGVRVVDMLHSADLEGEEAPPRGQHKNNIR